jgi:hypothetical protein
MLRLALGLLYPRERHLKRRRRKRLRYLLRFRDGEADHRRRR